MSADLHLHTTASDGSIKPADIVEIAHQLDLKAIAITDHDTVAGIEVALKKSQDTSVNVIPGVELSCDTGGRDIHLLAYWPDYNAPWFIKELSYLQKKRLERVKVMLLKLKEKNMDVVFEEVISIAGDATVGRSHIARAMMQKGYIDSIEEAFDKYLGRDESCYAEKPSRNPQEVIAMIRKAHGVAVFAHPGLADIDDMIPEMINDGLVGIEVSHPDHSVAQIKYYEEMASHYGLVPTAGSDFHAKGSGRGAMIGTCRVSMETVEELKSRLPEENKLKASSI